jgi:hypothetical protein
MWILPKQLHTSAFVPDTEALISDSTEQSQICAQSLLARSKPSPARTWSQRWKRDSWTAHLSGRILKPSHGPSFVTAWTSALSVTHASHLVQPASDSEPKTHDTSGHLFSAGIAAMRPSVCFLKTSRDISALGYPTFCKTWQDWVTERRGAWRARVNAARLTRGSGSSSWPTIRATEYKDVGPVGSQFSSACNNGGDAGLSELANAGRCAIREGAYWSKSEISSLSRMRRWASMAKPPRRAAVRLGAAKGCGHRSARQQAQRDEWPTANGERDLLVIELGRSQRCEQDSALRGESNQAGLAKSVGLELGNAASQREGRNENAEWQPSEGWDSAGDAGEAMGHPNSPRPQERPRQRAAGIQGADADGGEAAERQTQPPLGRDADGPADWLDDAELYTTCDNRTDELRLLGNGVVPAVAERAFRLLFGELTAHNTTQ